MHAHTMNAQTINAQTIDAQTLNAHTMETQTMDVKRTNILFLSFRLFQFWIKQHTYKLKILKSTRTLWNLVFNKFRQTFHMTRFKQETKVSSSSRIVWCLTLGYLNLEHWISNRGKYKLNIRVWKWYSF